MARKLLPLADDKPPLLRGFHCGACGWLYLRQNQECDYWELLADARALFSSHECSDYQVRSAA